MSHFLPFFKFRLYIVGEAPNSLQAIFNLEALCREHLVDRHNIEIVDVLIHPNRALADGIMLTPTLIRFLPEPVRRIIGTLADTRPLLQILELPVSPQ
jgi:circadian clock protein KaiB